MLPPSCSRCGKGGKTVKLRRFCSECGEVMLCDSCSDAHKRELYDAMRDAP